MNNFCVGDYVDVYQATLKEIRRAWGSDTAAKGAWDGQGSPARGQCAVTALVVNDLFGGEILRADLGNLGSHYWNHIEGMGEIDLTRDQYPPELDIPRGVVVPRARLLEGDRAKAARTWERYKLLCERLGMWL